MTADDRLIVALDVPNLLQGQELVDQIGDAVSFYKIVLGMLTGGGLALGNELKQERGKRIFHDMKLASSAKGRACRTHGNCSTVWGFLTQRNPTRNNPHDKEPQGATPKTL